MVWTWNQRGKEMCRAYVMATSSCQRGARRLADAVPGSPENFDSETRGVEDRAVELMTPKLTIAPTMPVITMSDRMKLSSVPGARRGLYDVLDFWYLPLKWEEWIGE
jgi:hypothetical protein